MFRNRTYALVLLLAATLILSPVTCLADGKIIIKPLLSTSWQMDTNFYKAETNEREVYTYLFQPGVDLGYKTAKSAVLLHYTLNAYWYDDRDALLPGEKAASDEDFVGHTGILNAESMPFDRLTLKLEDTYFKTRDPAKSDRFSDSVDRNKYWINRLTPKIFYNLDEKFTVGLSYRNTKTEYDQDLEEGSVENRGIFDLIYNFTPKRSIDLEYQYWQRDYDETTSTYTSNQAMLIYRQQFKFFTFEAGGGYEDRSFDDPTLDDIDTFCYIIKITGQDPPAPEANPNRNFMFSIDQGFNDSGIGDSYYKATRVTLAAGHIFFEKIVTGIKGYYQRSDYERWTGLTPEGTTELRDDNTYNISGNVGYMLTRWLTLGITAGYEKRKSNLAGYDYDDTSCMLKLDFAYSLGKK